MLQKKRKKVGSSETTREASVFNFDLVQSTDDYIPLKIKAKIDSLHSNVNVQLFLEWFIGFTEGDGSFTVIKFPTLRNPSNVRPCFRINQKHPQVLYRIKKELGFGRIHPVKEATTGAQYYRYSVYTLNHIKHLILIFNGNLILEKVRNRFACWVNAYNNLIDQEHFNLKIQYNSRVPGIDLNSAWLAGFTDADGGFYASLSSNKRYLTGFRERYKFYISQKGELQFLEKLDQLIQTTTLETASQYVSSHIKKLPQQVKPKKGSLIDHIYKVSEQSGIYKLEITKLANLQILINYFEKYPLFSKKQLVFVRWRRVITRRDALRAAALLSEKGMRRYKRLYSSIGKIREITSTE
uniref:putative site-specific DNA endonuclease n=1 Tax=Massjukichlorella minus TaxID=2650457 RepID=UPI0024116119|nr:putative site-specific DNA endonuclease [Massjukichlorella minus]WDY12955.1 putative site-specific DNA endonuclease [Massjukichlorella minus]